MANSSEVKYSIRQYFSTYDRFIIPPYQRGYKWGVKKTGMIGNENDASILVQDIINAFNNNTDEYFIQGVTVYEDTRGVVLIDGQQRTTTLFLLLSLLMEKDASESILWSSASKDIKLEYDIRLSSQQFLKHLIFEDYVFEEECTQDIFYMKQALKFMEDKISSFLKISQGPEKEKSLLVTYILDQVKLFYIKVEKDQANSVFSLMNGAKAPMKTDELIKASFLIKASSKENKDHFATETINDTLGILLKQVNSLIEHEWDINTVRSRYARMWDRWMYWWGKDEVKLFFRCGSNPMGLLLDYFYNSTKTDSDLDYSNEQENLPSVFKAFSNKFIKDPLTAVSQLEDLRKFQKKFEDIYNDSHSYNYLGYTLAVLNDNKEQRNAINFALNHFKEKESLLRYARLASIGCSSKIIEKFIDESCSDADYLEIEDKVNRMVASLKENDVYNAKINAEGRSNAFCQLYRLNIQEQDRFGKFSFIFFDDEKGYKREMFETRSLEHIWPKSKVVVERSNGSWYYYKNAETVDETDVEGEMSGYLKISKDVSDRKVSHNSIGNIVFLNTRDNSSFKCDEPEQKKQKLFTLKQKIYSRNCPHTIAAFAKDNWTLENALNIIENRKNEFIEKIQDDFKFVTSN